MRWDIFVLKSQLYVSCSWGFRRDQSWLPLEKLSFWHQQLYQWKRSSCVIWNLCKICILCQLSSQFSVSDRNLYIPYQISYLSSKTDIYLRTIIFSILVHEHINSLSIYHLPTNRHTYTCSDTGYQGCSWNLQIIYDSVLYNLLTFKWVASR